MVNLADIAGFQMMGALSQGKDPFVAMQEANVLKAQEQSFLAKAREEQRAAQNQAMMQKAIAMVQGMNPKDAFDTLNKIGIDPKTAYEVASTLQKGQGLGESPLPRTEGLPEGYMWQGDKASPIEGLPAIQNKEMFDREKDLRSRYEKRVAPLEDKIRSYQSAVELQAQDSGPADIGLIKMAVQAFDKRASIVTDTEFGQISETGGLVDRFGSAFKGYIAGQKLTENQRKQVLKVIEREAALAEKNLGKINKDFDSNAEKYGLDFKPVRADYGIPSIEDIKRQYDTKPAVINSENEWNNLPSGTLYIAPDGSTRRKK